MNVSRSTARLARLSLALAACFPVFTQAQSPGLREMVVHATRFPEPARSLPYGVSVVTGEEIARSGAATVNEALMRILGLPGRQDLYGGGEYRIDQRLGEGSMGVVYLAHHLALDRRVAIKLHRATTARASAVVSSGVSMTTSASSSMPSWRASSA